MRWMHGGKPIYSGIFFFFFFFLFVRLGVTGLPPGHLGIWPSPGLTTPLHWRLTYYNPQLLCNGRGNFLEVHGLVCVC